MSKVGQLNYGPVNQEYPWMEDLRKELGKYTNQTWVACNEPVAVDVLDFIGQYAADFAIRSHDLYFNNVDRLNSLGWAKSWVSGYFAWYLDPQNAEIRDKTTHQPDFVETCHAGCLIRAKKLYRNIPWTLGIIKRLDGPWLSNITEEALERINMNLMGCTVNTWKSTKLRAPLNFNIYLPSECTHSGLQLELGDEILSDWVLAPDPAHGHPFTTMCKLYKERKGPGSKVISTDSNTGRSAYELLSAGVWRIVVSENKVPPCVITFFKRS